METLTTHQILDETAAFYNSGNRAIGSDGRCKYLTDDGKSCAFGRCLTDEGRNIAHTLHEGTAANMIGSEQRINELLQPQYRGHAPVFWRYVQRFHDNEDNWTSTGLSPVGEAKLHELKICY